MTFKVVVSCTERDKSPLFPPLCRGKAQSEPEEARDGAGRESGVNWRFPASLQHGRLWRQVIFVAPNRARRLVFFQAEASPQQAEFLAAAVRPI